LDKSYVAAFLDGEGSVSFSLRVNSDGSLLLYPQIRFGNTNKEVIDALRNFLKLQGIKANQNVFRTGRKRPYHELQITGFRNILKFIELVEDKSIVKKKHLEIMKRFCTRRIKLHEASRIYWATHSHLKLQKKFVAYTREDLEDFLELLKLNGRKLSPIGQERLARLKARFF